MLLLLLPVPLLFLLSAGLGLSSPLPKPAKAIYGNEVESLAWLQQHQDEEVTANELASKFDWSKALEEDKVHVEWTKGRMPQSMGQKAPEFAYSHALARDKFLPMAAAAYGTEEDIQKCLSKTFESAELHRNVLVPCNGHDGQKCSGFVALSHSDRAVILAFRGTASFMQLTMETSRILFISQSNATLGGKVASYFAEIFAQLSEEGLVQETLDLARTYPDYELWITGHSLGGALASLAAAEIYASKLIGPEKIKLVTLGQPRTGNSQWTEAFSQALPHYNYRIVNERDVVAHVPIRRFQDYRHFKSEIWYKNGMEQEKEEGNELEFVQCEEADEDDRNCSNSLWTFSVRQHRHYFGHVVDVYGKGGCRDS